MFKFLTASELRSQKFVSKTDVYAIELPYGMYICKDGSEVLFNRGYEPILKRHAGVITYPKPHSWVDGVVDQVVFYNDGCSARHDKNTRDRCKKVIEVFKSNGNINNLVFTK